ncbi:hypothetical protein [Microbulbifer sp.]|uniref:HIT family protein n=1 Tax=Microbulbifer sp. TaxID=1908541 RepID=UPI002587218A|nr:hypothetical protein [Microbulbifer sp.]
MNVTMERFGYKKNLICEYNNWCVLLRDQQVTLGSVVIIEKSNSIALADVTPESFAELATVISDYENVVSELYPVRRFNYMALMMVDPNVHFHVVPRYESDINEFNYDFSDSLYPSPPNLSKVNNCSADVKALVLDKIVSQWPKR